MSKVYEIIQNKFIDQIQKVIDGSETLLPWQKPWRGSRPMNYFTGKHYRGINTLLLEGGEWLTFIQIKNLAKKDPNIRLKKGSKSSIIVFFDFKEKKDKETGEIEVYPMLRYSNVFSISDVVGIESKLPPKNEEPLLEEAEQIIEDYINRENLRLDFVDGSNRAYYQPASDRVVMPEKAQFQGIKEYYATAFHELSHSTGHEKRLNRFTSSAKDHKFGSENYSKEELVAEISSQMVLGRLNINDDAIASNSLAYAHGWLKAIKEDVKLIISASSQAQKSCDFILGEEYLNNELNLEGGL